MQGQLVSLKDTIDGFEEILEGKLDDIPEAAFYMVGDVASVRVSTIASIYEQYPANQTGQGRADGQGVGLSVHAQPSVVEKPKVDANQNGIRITV